MSPLYRASCFMLLCLTGARALAQNDTAVLHRLETMPLHYVVSKTDTPPTIDGDLTDPAWQTAPWTEYFTDIEGDVRPKPTYHTRVKMLWDDQYLYIAAELEEPNVWAYQQNHDDIVFRDNDFEVFINPDNNARHYFEIEINAIKTIFDLFLPEPYSRGGGALVSWDATGLKKAVHVSGTVNDPTDTDKGWTVEYAIPISSISMGNGPQTPHPGSLWRINFSRVEWDTDVRDGKYVKRTDPQTQRPLPEHNWVWSPQGVINMHYPERWGYLLFAGAGAPPEFTLPLPEKLKYSLWIIYYRETLCHSLHGEYTAALDQLGIDPDGYVDGQPVEWRVEATKSTYKAFVSVKATGETWSIDAQGFLENIGRRP